MVRTQSDRAVARALVFALRAAREQDCVLVQRGLERDQEAVRVFRQPELIHRLPVRAAYLERDVSCPVRHDEVSTIQGGELDAGDQRRVRRSDGRQLLEQEIGRRGHAAGPQSYKCVSGAADTEVYGRELQQRQRRDQRRDFATRPLRATAVLFICPPAYNSMAWAFFV